MGVTSRAETIYTFDGFQLDSAKRLIFGPDGEILPLMPKAFDILSYLVGHHGQVVPKDELMSAVWGDTIVEENNLTQNISAIRRALGEKHGDNRFIATVPGRGYKFVADVETVDDDEDNTADAEPGTAATAGDVIRSDNRDAFNSARSWLLVIGLISAVALALVGVYRLTRNPDPSDGQISSIAVLPFKPVSVENRDEALEMGMADTLISKLSGSGDLRVSPLAAVRRFTSLEQDAGEAGRQLGVQAVLDGGVQIAGNRVRVSAQLIRVNDGKQIWSGQFDQALTDIFEVQDSISERVAAALKVPLSNQSRKSYTGSVEAYQLYTKGKFHTGKLILPEVQRGISYFEQAIAADPSYALAYVELSNAYRAMVLTNEASPSELMTRARAAAERAIELDSGLPDAWASLAFSNFWFEWDWRSSEENFKKALALDPNSAKTHAFYAHLLSNTGRHAEAIAEIRRARLLDPLDMVINAMEGQILCFAGQTDESINVLRSSISVAPDFWLAHLFISRAFIEKGMMDDAIAAATTARDITEGNTEATATIAFALAKSGRRDDVLKVLAELNLRARSRFVPSYCLAQVHLALGEREEAMNLLDKAYAQREPLMVFLKVEQKWNELRSEKRFNELINRMALN